MKKTSPLVSIVIVDYKKDNPYLLEALSHIQKQTYKNWEVVLVTDFPTKTCFKKVTNKYYHKVVGPAKKRDDGARISQGEIICFLDDDAYPSPGWLTQIVKEFESSDVCAVGGPGVTPPSVSWQEEASGWASASPIGSGGFVYRFLPQKKRFVDDFPSMNLAVRKSDFFRVGGFDSSYYPGEDTKLCLDLVHKLNKKIVYSPKALVFHHRRPIIWPHLKQNGNFGIHRGFFARVLPKTSLRLVYFAPPLLFLMTLLTPLIFRLSQSFTSLSSLYLLPTILYLVYFCLLSLNALWVYYHSKKIHQALLSIFTIFITHLWYGFRFLQGFFFTDKLVK